MSPGTYDDRNVPNKLNECCTLKPSSKSSTPTVPSTTTATGANLMTFVSNGYKGSKHPCVTTLVSTTIGIITEKDKRPSSTTRIRLNSQFLESSRSIHAFHAHASALAATAKIIGASCYTCGSSSAVPASNRHAYNGKYMYMHRADIISVYHLCIRIKSSTVTPSPTGTAIHTCITAWIADRPLYQR